MKIQWMGHAAVLLTSESGKTIVTDPFERRAYSFVTRGALVYDEFKGTVDIAVVTHEHPDHNYVAPLGGNPAVVHGMEICKSGPVTAKGIEFKAIPTYHDNAGGKKLGDNSVVYFYLDGFKICHTGDLGHTLSKEQRAELGDIDILLLSVGLLEPVGEPKQLKDVNGNTVQTWNQYIIDAGVANQILEQFAPKVTIPIHFANEKCTFNLANLPDFLDGKKNVVMMEGSEVEFKKGELPTNNPIIVLKPAL